MKARHIITSAVFFLVMLMCIPAMGQDRPPRGEGGPRGPRGDFRQMRARAVLETIFNRKSVRKYNGVVVPKDTLEILVKAAMAAPTAMNRQPWHFYATNNSEIIEAAAASLGRSANMVKEAGACIVVCGVPEESDKFWYVDATCAAENLLLAAEAMGLGAVWLSAYPNEERMNSINTAFGIPENYKVLCLIPVGHPAGQDKPKDKWKPERFHFDTW